ncbi:MAG: hypothetical protein RLZZ347_635 [Candidatus Parcubacteria bacterium]|jgi:hypothetical protein
MKVILSLLLAIIAYKTSAATINVTNSTVVPAQNIAVNVPNQILGAFETTVTDEPVVINLMIWRYLPKVGVSSLPPIYNIVIVDQNNTVIAGPVSSPDQLVFFTDRVVFPVGKSTYYLKGRLDSGFTNNQSFEFRTRPSVGWSYTIPFSGAGGLGEVSGSPVPLPDQDMALSTITAKRPSLRIRPDPAFQPQRIFGGRTGIVMGQFLFDASESSEDVRITSIQMSLTTSNVSAMDLTYCQLFDGTTVLNSGYNSIHPARQGTITFPFDTWVTIPKGTVKTLTLKGNTSWQIGNGTLSWSVASPQTVSTATGVQSSIVVSTSDEVNCAQSEVKPGGWALGKILWVRDVGPGDPLWVGSLQPGVMTASVASVEFDCDPALRYKIQASTDLKVWYDALGGAGFMQPDASNKIGCYTYFLKTNGLTNAFRAVAQ